MLLLYIFRSILWSSTCHLLTLLAVGAFQIKLQVESYPTDNIRTYLLDIRAINCTKNPNITSLAIHHQLKSTFSKSSSHTSKYLYIRPIHIVAWGAVTSSQSSCSREDIEGSLHTTDTSKAISPTRTFNMDVLPCKEPYMSCDLRGTPSLALPLVPLRREFVSANTYSHPLLAGKPIKRGESSFTSTQGRRRENSAILLNFLPPSVHILLFTLLWPPGLSGRLRQTFLEWNSISSWKVVHPNFYPASQLFLLLSHSLLLFTIYLLTR